MMLFGTCSCASYDQIDTIRIVINRQDVINNLTMSFRDIPLTLQPGQRIRIRIAIGIEASNTAEFFFFPLTAASGPGLLTAVAGRQKAHAFLGVLPSTILYDPIDRNTYPPGTHHSDKMLYTSESLADGLIVKGNYVSGYSDADFLPVFFEGLPAIWTANDPTREYFFTFFGYAQSIWRHFRKGFFTRRAELINAEFNGQEWLMTPWAAHELEHIGCGFINTSIHIGLDPTFFMDEFNTVPFPVEMSYSHARAEQWSGRECSLLFELEHA